MLTAIKFIYIINAVVRAATVRLRIYKRPSILTLIKGILYRFGRLIRELRALPMATTPGGENNLLSAIFFRISYVPHSKMFNFQTCNFL